jgi:hypothetical protein
MYIAPNADWELIGYLSVWFLLSLGAGLMIEYAEKKSKKNKKK